MTAEHGVVGEGHVVADLAIVSDMGADHEEAALADAGHAAAVFGPGIHGDAFAQLAARADQRAASPRRDNAPIAAACRATRTDRRRCPRRSS